jgi:hypothetical protein
MRDPSGKMIRRSPLAQMPMRAQSQYHVIDVDGNENTVDQTHNKKEIDAVDATEQKEIIHKRPNENSPSGSASLFFTRFLCGLYMEETIRHPCFTWSMNLLGMIIGLMMFMKAGMQEGALSFYGSIFRLIFFSGFAAIQFSEPSWNLNKKIGNALPHIASFLLTCVQLYGLSQNYDCKSFVSCL